MNDIVICLKRAVALAACLVGLSAFPAPAAHSAQLFDVQMTSKGSETQVILGLAQPTAFHAAVDAAKGAATRIAIDFQTMTMIPSPVVMRGIGLVRNYHAEPLIGGGVRLILDLARPAVIVATHALPAVSGKPSRIVFELKASDAPAPVAPPEVAARPQAVVPSAIGPKDSDSIGALIEAPEPHVLSPPRTVALAKAAVPAPAPPPETRSMVTAGITAPAPPRSAEKPSISSIISPRRTIVVDAGHGGIDPGAESIAGDHEKEITLATARLLKRALEQTGRYNVVMTRDSDVYLKLHERVARARAAHGNLFISLHADSVADAGMQTASARITRGASIYTLSETASDVESDRYAQRENRADAIGGVNLGGQSDDVAGILVDLTVRETVNDGNRLAAMMVESLENQGVSLLPTTPHRSAGFAVLKSPDIPSVLIEMGYLSDMSDARGLADPRHQQQIAKAIVDGVDRYFSWLQVSRS